MQVMLDEMERHYGKRPIIYTTVDFYQAILADGAFPDYPIWVRSTKYHPSVKYGGRAWRFWQYQSDAYVPGIAAKVDKDAFYGTPSNGRPSCGSPASVPRTVNSRRRPRPPLSLPAAPAPEPAVEAADQAPREGAPQGASDGQ